MKTILSITALCAIILTGCTPVPPKDAGGTAAAQVAANAAKPGCDQTTPSGLGYRMLKAGEGNVPGERDKVTINYKGSLAANGAVFDENKGASFGVALGWWVGASGVAHWRQNRALFSLSVPQRVQNIGGDSSWV